MHFLNPALSFGDLYTYKTACLSSKVQAAILVWDLLTSKPWNCCFLTQHVIKLVHLFILPCRWPFLAIESIDQCNHIIKSSSFFWCECLLQGQQCTGNDCLGLIEPLTPMITIDESSIFSDNIWQEHKKTLFISDCWSCSPFTSHIRPY